MKYILCVLGNADQSQRDDIIVSYLEQVIAGDECIHSITPLREQWRQVEFSAQDVQWQIQVTPAK